MIWTDLSSAPEKGTFVALAADVNGATVLTVTTAAGDFPLLLVRRNDGVIAFVNMCPHQFLPLDYRSNQVLSVDGSKLMCSAHGAMFDAGTGAGVGGNGLGCDLIPVPVAQIDGQIVIG
ncbi:Rieske 2Fe-2S domain-containing protein [Sulfitobacter sp. M39]|jgi:nitrite reductase/ring-hydroxylating ferredoxin subunit|uniref:Rieske (2Fe-2S) protein n=1 Tax=Sulfitobacter sp. M39 TaxID=2675334 RepID=UPI001F1FBA46|nr:Rieske 2Fe-2S domain-containing protein [Sulfitobacter sp. M39]MCF7748495.1 Rieske 2Fe-2S domain-containing protein [Sulfitobacter sp. M39]